MSEYSKENCRKMISRSEDAVTDAKEEIEKHFGEMDFENATSYAKAEEMVNVLKKKCKEINELLADAQFR